MTTLNELKKALLAADAATQTATRPLSAREHSDSFAILTAGPGRDIYDEFIIPNLIRHLTRLCDSHEEISILEVGPGPKSVLAHVPGHIRRRIAKYVAYEPNEIFAAALEPIMTPLLSSVTVRQLPFSLDCDVADRFDVVLFCHSLYGLKPHQAFVRHGLKLLGNTDDGLVIVFHREESLSLPGLACYHSGILSTSKVGVPNSEATVDKFAAFIAGSVAIDETARRMRRDVCFALGRQVSYKDSSLYMFLAPTIMFAFRRGATSPLPQGVDARPDVLVKNREARRYTPSVVLRPETVSQVQDCVSWAIRTGVALSIVGGAHSGHCVLPSVVAVDMSAFNEMELVHMGSHHELNGLAGPSNPQQYLLVAGAGCKSGDILAKTMAHGLTVPLGSRPSVGAGMWLQGGMGHLTRKYGLTCDAIVGAVMVSLDKAQVQVVGNFPKHRQPAGAVRPPNEAELLWALRGAGTNFGIVVSIAFRTFPAMNFTVNKWLFPLEEAEPVAEGRKMMKDFSTEFLPSLKSQCSADVYILREDGKTCLAVTLVEGSTGGQTEELTADLSRINMGRPICITSHVDALGLLDTEMYISDMHGGGHGGGKTSAFKRCVFLSDIGNELVAGKLLASLTGDSPTELCYLHLLHAGVPAGSAAIEDDHDMTAFGSRNWQYACVITGVWPRHMDGTSLSRDCMSWVYRVYTDLLPFAAGVYMADLGPNSAYEPGLWSGSQSSMRGTDQEIESDNRRVARLERLKRLVDPHGVLPYAWPLRPPSANPAVIVLVTGMHGAGKDFCASAWARAGGRGEPDHKAGVVQISDVFLSQYAAATGADEDKLRTDRKYKELHRQDMAAFFNSHQRQCPLLMQERFLDVVFGDVAAKCGLLFITGMREKAPVAAYAHLLPTTRLVEVRVEASFRRRRERRGTAGVHRDEPAFDDWAPTYTVENSKDSQTNLLSFARTFLRPLMDDDLATLRQMVVTVHNFPRPRVAFRHVLNIAQEPGGLHKCARLLHKTLGVWDSIDAVVACEAGGFVFASALVMYLDQNLNGSIPQLLLIRAEGKLPPPVVSSVGRTASHIGGGGPAGARLEMETGVVGRGAKVAVVDDVLASGETLCAVLELLGKDGVRAEDITVLVVAEFPEHRGRQLLYEKGWGRVCVHSLLVFGGY